MKKYIFAFAAICMMAASVCLTSCGSDDDTPDPQPQPTPVERKYSDTLKISGFISEEVKEMLKLHYYEVDKNGEKEISAIPTIHEIFSEQGIYNRGIKITSDFKLGENEKLEDFEVRLKNELKDWVAKSGKKYTDIKIRSSFHCSISHGQSIDAEWLNVADEQDAREQFTEEEIFLILTTKIYNDLCLDPICFAYTITITDKYDTSGRKPYVWQKY